MKAVVNHDMASIKVLIKIGADIDLSHKDIYGNTLEMLACNDENILKILKDSSK